MKRSGGKFTPSHTTIIESSADFVDFAKKSNLVTKITLGLIKGLPKSRGGIIKSIKCTHEPACLFIKVRGNRAIQDIRLFSNNIKALESEIIELAKKLKFRIS